MRLRVYIWLVFLFVTAALPLRAATDRVLSFDFYGDTISFNARGVADVPFADSLTPWAIHTFYERMLSTEYEPVVGELLAYKQRHKPDDWVFYQLVRRTAEQMSPKAENYYRYTLYKWFLLTQAGYDATLNITGDKLLFYVQSDEDIYDLPTFNRNGKTYICLNYHDYHFNIDFTQHVLTNVPLSIPGAVNKFSYRLTQLPDFRPQDYSEKDISFSYHDVNYHFRIKMNEEVRKMFTNYPVADYQLYFNEPLSKGTYSTLIPQLRENTKGMNTQQGIDYLMHFTRYAFSYQPDQENFGREKHLSPEQTLLYDRSDCEDRSALFYCLVKELYNLPMIVLAFPHHLTIAVKFDKPVGNPIFFNGSAYTICEPTPQAEDLPIGGISTELKKAHYDVAYVYEPAIK